MDINTASLIKYHELPLEVRVCAYIGTRIKSTNPSGNHRRSERSELFLFFIVHFRKLRLVAPRTLSHFAIRRCSLRAVLRGTCRVLIVVQEGSVSAHFTPVFQSSSQRCIPVVAVAGSLLHSRISIITYPTSRTPVRSI